MWIEERQKQLMAYLAEHPEITVRELAQKLHVSEPTVRRDLTELDARGLVQKIHGGAVLRGGMADREIPFLLRENERSIAKAQIGRMASDYIEDGMVVMLDGSSSAYHLVPYLVGKKDLIVVTSGAKTAVSLAEANIRTFSTGGQMRIHSFSYVGADAENFVRKINADILFFSCHGLDLDGTMSDRSIDEASLRQVMFAHAKKKILLCDKSKIGNRYFYNMGNLSEVDACICDVSLPEELARLLK
ncbi:MAG: DeoR/GlpR transcriptional regulator [Clostridia bacterium]|nr:DeoR/GlpR transcriptional regulator [Clostridia bacterium]